MPVQSVNIPEGLKKQLEERMKKKDYQNLSEFIREAIREKLQKDTRLRPEEIQRIMNIRERERRGEQEWLTKDELMENLDIDESEV